VQHARMVAARQEVKGGGHVGVAWNARGPRTVPIRRVYLLQPTYRLFHFDCTSNRPRVIYLPIPLAVASSLSLAEK